MATRPLFFCAHRPRVEVLGTPHHPSHWSHLSHRPHLAALAVPRSDIAVEDRAHGQSTHIRALCAEPPDLRQCTCIPPKADLDMNRLLGFSAGQVRSTGPVRPTDRTQALEISAITADQLHRHPCPNRFYRTIIARHDQDKSWRGDEAKLTFFPPLCRYQEFGAMFRSAWCRGYRVHIIAQCPRCRYRWWLDAAAVDRRLRCPKCFRLLKVPDLAQIPNAADVMTRARSELYVDETGRTYG
jgi:hypothetical protein